MSKLKRGSYRPANDFLRRAVDSIKSKGFKQDDLFAFMGLSSKSIRRGDRSFPSNNESQPILTKKIVALLHLCSGVNPYDLLLEKEREADLLKKPEIKTKEHTLYTHDFHKIFTRIFKDKNPIISINKIPQEIDNPMEEYQKIYTTAYTDRIVNYYNDAKNSITVLETTMKGNNNNKTSNLFCNQVAQKQNFYAIENKLKNIIKKDEQLNPKWKNNFKYVRIFSLDPSDSLHEKRGSENLIEALLIESSSAVLAHMYRCLKNYPDNCDFYITNTTRFRHQCKIDDRFLLTEDYVRSNKCIIPETLTIQDISLYPDLKILGKFDSVLNDEGELTKIDLQIYNDRVIDDLILKLKNRIEAKNILYQFLKNSDLPNSIPESALTKLRTLEYKRYKILENHLFRLELKKKYLTDIGKNLFP